STMLLKFCDQLYDQNTRYRQLSGTVAYPSRDIAQEHSAICDAVLARDPDEAARLLLAHYRFTSTFLNHEADGVSASAQVSLASTKSKSTR
ncbi:FCD domain-containing protein, partial [Rhizobiaceae bacterium]|nr:FCD domain-containing protein [Rhizobiaceae bacterium]